MSLTEFNWLQTEGPAVLLVGGTGLVQTFYAPIQPTSSSLVFRMSVADPDVGYTEVTINVLAVTGLYHDIHGLMTGTTYEVAVRATNVLGDSGWSLPRQIGTRA